MMFSIQKRRKIQIFHLQFSNPSAEQIRSSINRDAGSEVVNFLQKFNQERVESILDMKSDLVEKEIKSYLTEPFLIEYFSQFPSAWADLKKKLHAHRSSRGERYFIDKEDEENITPILLRLGRGKDIGESIEGAFYRDILNNSALIKHASREPSLLDSSHGNLGFLSKEHQHKKSLFVQRIIEFGIASNVDDSEEIEGHFRELFPHMLAYLKKIFNIDFSGLPKKPTLKNISTYIVEHIWTEGSGFEAKKAWMLAKSFTAWGSYREISELQETGKQQIHHIQDRLEQQGIHMEKGETQTEIIGDEPVEIFPGTLSIPLEDGSKFQCKIEYRLKSMRSILLKMWENEDYNTVDALRDMIGIAVVWPDDTPNHTKIQVMGKFSQIMSDRGYLLKNKGLFRRDKKEGVDEVGELDAYLKASGKNPLGGIVSKKRGKTNANFINASISGFTSLDDAPTGLEVQFFDQSKYDFWKEDHYTYDPLKIFSAISRGSWFLTPHQALHGIQKEIPDTVRADILKKRPQEILYSYLQGGQLKAFSGKDGEIYLVPRDHISNFEEKFPKDKVRPIVINRGKGGDGIKRDHDDFKDFILNLKTADAAQSTL